MKPVLPANATDSASSFCASKAFRLPAAGKQQSRKLGMLFISDNRAATTCKVHDLITLETGFLAPSPKISSREIKCVAKLHQHVK
ncbi:hypothetical protein [Nitrosospira sp. NRS527]|uniref:hypothetical protein n=1 Tax=Nitrosospira sp. NRS527 TaxID=155925 RepID=UPI001BD016DF|nr:hypothetical protein [Nitrosospira sp. NRS527]